MWELREELGIAGQALGEVGRYSQAGHPGPCVVLLADFDRTPYPNGEIFALRRFTRDQVEALVRAGPLRMGLELDAIARGARQS